MKQVKLISSKKPVKPPALIMVNTEPKLTDQDYLDRHMFIRLSGFKVDTQNQIISGEGNYSRSYTCFFVAKLANNHYVFAVESYNHQNAQKVTRNIITIGQESELLALLNSCYAYKKNNELRKQHISRFA